MPILGSLGPSHQRHKSRVSLRGPLVPMVFRALDMEWFATLGITIVSHSLRLGVTTVRL